MIAVDIDPAMLEIATKYFGLVQDEQLEIVIEDGIEFLKKSVKKGKKIYLYITIGYADNNSNIHLTFAFLVSKNSGKVFKAILFDIDSKDSSIGMSFPPLEFLNQEVLESVKECIKDKGTILYYNIYQIRKFHLNKFNILIGYFAGVFILNLVTRDETLRESAFKKLRQHFQTIVSYKLEEDVNEIVFCQNGEHDIYEWKKRMEQSVQNVNKVLSAHAASQKDVIEVQEFLSELKL